MGFYDGCPYSVWNLALQGKTQGILFWAAFYTFVICEYSGLKQLASHNARFVLQKPLSKNDIKKDDNVKAYYQTSNPAKSWLKLPSKKHGADFCNQHHSCY